MYMINLMIIYDVINMFSMKTCKSSRKLMVGLNWYPGMNWSTTTIVGQTFDLKILLKIYLFAWQHNSVLIMHMNIQWKLMFKL